MPKFADGCLTIKGRSPAPPERCQATPDEIKALKTAGVKLSRKERRAELAQQRHAAKCRVRAEQGGGG